jgi:hypothetical protein
MGKCNFLATGSDGLTQILKAAQCSGSRFLAALRMTNIWSHSLVVATISVGLRAEIE